MRRTVALLGVLVIVAGGRAAAELVRFARGGEARLNATSEGDRVRLETPDGPKWFPREAFATIVPGHRPLEDWAKRRDQASRDGGAEARFAAAWWALEHGLTDEAIATLNELRPAAPLRGPIARAIAAVDRLTTPSDDSDLDALKIRLRPNRFREARGPHVVLLHQLAESEASERLDVIERVVSTLLISFAAQGIELHAPGRRLISVCFADRRDYVAFLRRSEAEAFIDTQGYYHPSLRVVFTFDTRSTDDQRTGRRAIANRKVAGDPPSEIDRRLLLLDLEWRETDLGILAHETVHQLVAETGLAPRFDDFPSWLHEGLAEQFEVVHGGRWAGVGRVNDRRLLDWRSIKPAPRLPPLLHDVGLGRGYHRQTYAQAWALVYFLRKSHPRQFLTFLDLLRNPTSEASLRPDRAFEAFRSAFGGDLGAIEAEWHRQLADLRTLFEDASIEAR
jgi:hypothetical protein